MYSTSCNFLKDPEHGYSQLIGGRKKRKRGCSSRKKTNLNVENLE